MTDPHHESGTDLDVYVGGERVEMLYLSPGDSFEMEVWPDVTNSEQEMTIDPGEFDETVTAECPHCGQFGEVPAEWVGWLIECKNCGARMPVEDDDDE